MELERNRLYKAKNGDEFILLSETVDIAGDVAILDVEGSIAWAKPKDLTPLPIDEYFLKHIDKPFGLLSEDAQEALKAIENEDNIQHVGCGTWINRSNPAYAIDITYRLDPEWESAPETVTIKIAKEDLRLLDGIKYEKVKN